MPTGLRKEGTTISTKLFVGNLNYATKGDEIERLFSEAGEVVSVSVPVDRETGRPRGFCFVEMATADGAAEAILRFNGHEVGGRSLRVNQAEERRRDDRPRSPKPRSFGDRPPRQDGDGRSARQAPGFRPPRRFAEDGGSAPGPAPDMFEEPPPFDRWGGGEDRRGGSGKGKSRRNLRRNKRSL